MRVACLLVPDLPLAAELRAHPELEGLPVAIVSEPGPRASLLAVSRRAARSGVHPGSSLTHARSVCAKLRVRVTCPALERAARRALLDVALSTSPRAEEAPRCSGERSGEAAVYLDACGVGALFGSEKGLATALTARAARLGLPAVATVAPSRTVAHLMARRLPLDASRSGGTWVLAPGSERSFLAELPVDLLDPDAALADTLTRFGIRRLGQLLALPHRSLATRLGPEAQHLVARVLGERGEPPLPVLHGSRLEEELDLEASLDRLEPLAFVLRGMLSRLLARLTVRRLACADLDLAFRLAGGGRETRRLGLAAPTLDARILLRRLRLALESAPPAAPVEGVSLATEGRPFPSDQLDLFRPAGPAPAALDALLAELEALCGPGRVGAARVADEHRPDAFEMGRFAPDSIPAAGPERRPHPPAAKAATLAVRALRPPTAARVRMRAGRPFLVQSSVANGHVVRCAGPWRTTGSWWSEENRFAFDHFDILTSDGLLTRLRFDRLRRTWLVDGIYD